MKLQIIISLAFIFLIFGCDSLFNDYNSEYQFEYEQVDQETCILFRTSPTIINVVSLEDTSFTSFLDSVSFVIQDSSNVLSINNRNCFSADILIADTSYVVLYIDQDATANMIYVDASIALSVRSVSNGSLIKPTNSTLTIETIASCPTTKTRLEYVLKTGYYLCELRTGVKENANFVILNDNISPEALFAGFPVQGLDSLEVQFEDLSINGTFPITSWQWDFGDATNDSSNLMQNPIHIYTAPDTYTVSLTISDGTLYNSIYKKDMIMVANNE